MIDTATQSIGCTEYELSAAEERLGGRLPPALRSSYARWGRCTGLSWQDPLLSPGHLARDRDGFIAFRSENQGCALWAFHGDDAAADPTVHLDPAPFTARSRWQPDLGTVSEFFVHITLSAAIFSGAHNNNCAIDHEGALTAVEARFAPLHAPDFLWWPDPHLDPIRFFGGPDILIADLAHTWLWVATLTSEAHDEVRRLLPGDWLIAP